MRSEAERLALNAKRREEGKRPEVKKRRQAATKRWAEKNPEQWKLLQERSRMRRVYGVELEELRRRLEEDQAGRCLICLEPLEWDSRNRHVDHDHESGLVRGILCGLCNTAIGKLRDDPEIMRRAANYVENFRKILGPLEAVTQ